MAVDAEHVGDAINSLAKVLVVIDNSTFLQIIVFILVLGSFLFILKIVVIAIMKERKNDALNLLIEDCNKVIGECNTTLHMCDLTLNDAKKIISKDD